MANHIRMLTVSASDHLTSLAGSLVSTAAGINASYTLSRGLLEAASRAWYLADLDIDTRERLRRYMNERLWSINESTRFLRGMGDGSDVPVALAQAILEAAGSFGFTVTPGKRSDPNQLGDARPSVMKCVDLALVSAGFSEGFGETTYRFLSSIAHGTETGLAGLLVGGPQDRHGHTFAKNSEQQAKYFMAPVLAYVVMGDRFIAYFGWHDTQWERSREEALAFWMGHATQGLTNSSEQSHGSELRGGTVGCES